MENSLRRVNSSELFFVGNVSLESKSLMQIKQLGLAYVKERMVGLDGVKNWSLRGSTRYLGRGQETL